MQMGKKRAEDERGNKDDYVQIEIEGMRTQERKCVEGRIQHYKLIIVSEVLPSMRQ